MEEPIYTATPLPSVEPTPTMEVVTGSAITITDVYTEVHNINMNVTYLLFVILMIFLYKEIKSWYRGID